MDNLVKYSNKMHKVFFKNFTQRDSNFFMSICSRLKDNTDSVVEFEFSELREMADYKDTSRDRFVRDLTEMNKKLNEIDGHFETDEEIVTFNLFSTFRILKTKDIVKIRVNPDFKDFLIEFSKGFTVYELKEFVSLESIYAKALFRYLKQWRTQGKTPVYSPDEIKLMLDTPDYEPKFIKKFILEPAVQEIQQKGYFKNLTLEIAKEKKRGAPVKGYYFTFEPEQAEKSNKVIKETKKKGRPKKNKFNDFEQRQDIDFDDLESKLLSN